MKFDQTVRNWEVLCSEAGELGENAPLVATLLKYRGYVLIMTKQFLITIFNHITGEEKSQKWHCQMWKHRPHFD